MQRSRKSSFVPSLSSMLDRDINPGCASNEKDGRGDLMMGVETMPDVSDAEEAVQPSIIIESIEQLPPTEGDGEEGAHPMTGLETLPDLSEDEVEPTIIDQSKEPLLGSRGDEEDNPRVGIDASQMVKSTISSDSIVVDEDKPADRVQLKTPLTDSMEVDESLPVDGVDLKKSSDRSIAQIKEENDVNGDESYKTKLSVHLVALFEPCRSLQIAPAKKNPSMRIIIPPKLSKGKRKSTFKMAEVYLQAGVQFILQSVNAD